MLTKVQNEMLQTPGAGGSGGVKNFIENGDADQQSSIPNNFYTYVDDTPGTRPTGEMDTGATPDITLDVNESVPLTTAKSYEIIKPSGIDCQGQGVAVKFNVPPVYRAKSVKIQIPYMMSSSSTAGSDGVDSTYIVYIRHVATEKVIEPSNIKFFTADYPDISDIFEATFQTLSEDISEPGEYELLIHCTTTDTTAGFLIFNEPVITPQASSYGQNKPQVYSCKVNSSGVVDDPIPSTRQWIGNATVDDTSRYTFPIYGFSQAPKVIATVLDISGASQSAAYISVSPTQIQVRSLAGGAKAANAFHLLVTPTGIDAPVESRLSDGYDGRSVTVYGTASANVYDSPVKLPITHVSMDKASMVDLPNNRVVIKTAGEYTIEVDGTMSTASGTDLDRYHQVAVNGSLILNFVTTGTYASLASRKATLDLKVGDYIEFYSLVGTGGPYSSAIHFNITKNQSPQIINESEKIACRYTSNSGASVTTSTATYLFGTRDYDTHGIYNPSSGELKVPTPGEYEIKATLSVGGQGSTTALFVRIYVNGADKSSAFKTVPASTGNQVTALDTLYLKPTDVVTIKTELSTGSIATYTDHTINHLTVKRIK